jgi:hypothetical protein
VTDKALVIDLAASVRMQERPTAADAGIEVNRPGFVGGCC